MLLYVVTEFQIHPRRDAGMEAIKHRGLGVTALAPGSNWHASVQQTHL